ncbi:hypothetical protein GCM10020218_083600 [Dactylosporangium vinaceum]
MGSGGPLPAAPGRRSGWRRTTAAAAVNLAAELVGVSGGRVIDSRPVAARNANT